MNDREGPMPLDVVILAAGQGSRMKTALPKVMHTVGGIPMLQRVVEAAKALQPHKIHVVYGNGGSRVKDDLAHLLCIGLSKSSRKAQGMRWHVPSNIVNPAAVFWCFTATCPCWMLPYCRL